MNGWHWIENTRKVHYLRGPFSLCRRWTRPTAQHLLMYINIRPGAEDLKQHNLCIHCYRANLATPPVNDQAPAPTRPQPSALRTAPAVMLLLLALTPPAGTQMKLHQLDHTSGPGTRLSIAQLAPDGGDCTGFGWQVKPLPKGTLFSRPWCLPAFSTPPRRPQTAARAEQFAPDLAHGAK